jgi:hypothetical protein
VPEQPNPSLNGKGALPRNWRSFTGIWRKANAGTVRRVGSAVLAFEFRDMAEIERQNAWDGGRPRRARRPARGCRI